MLEVASRHSQVSQEPEAPFVLGKEVPSRQQQAELELHFQSVGDRTAKLQESPIYHRKLFTDTVLPSSYQVTPAQHLATSSAEVGLLLRLCMPTPTLQHPALPHGRAATKGSSMRSFVCLAKSTVNYFWNLLSRHSECLLYMLSKLAGVNNYFLKAPGKESQLLCCCNKVTRLMNIHPSTLSGNTQCFCTTFIIFQIPG